MLLDEYVLYLFIYSCHFPFISCNTFISCNSLVLTVVKGKWILPCTMHQAAGFVREDHDHVRGESIRRIQVDLGGSQDDFQIVQKVSFSMSSMEISYNTAKTHFI